jgi:hypothetical protein
MKRDKSGERLWPDFRVRVVMPGQKDIIWRSRAGPRRGYTLDGIQTMLEQVAEHLEKQFPSVEFRMVELEPNRFNFLYEGRKESMAPIQTCPTISQSVKVSINLCATAGHDINTFQNGMRVTPQGQQMDVATYCKKCGFGLSEIRGQIEQSIQAAVQQERIAQKQSELASMVPKQKGPIELYSAKPETGGISDSASKAASE